MALNIRRVIEEDFVVTYWRISDIQFNYSQSNIVVILAGYSTIESRTSGMTPITGTVVNITGENFKDSMTRIDVYSYIKSIPEWSNATDC